MSLTPQITLTATLLDYSGNALGSVASPAYLRIALCGFGQTLPCIPGTGNIGQVASWPGDIPYTGTMLSVKLWGNDVVKPVNETYYAISILDANRNVIQAGIYQFTGTRTIDLSNAVQVQPAQFPNLPYVADQPCSGPVPGSLYVAPGPILALFYNGMKLRPGTSLPILGFTGVGTNTATLNFTTETGDWIDALCVV